MLLTDFAERNIDNSFISRAPSLAPSCRPTVRALPPVNGVTTEYQPCATWRFSRSSDAPPSIRAWPDRWLPAGDEASDRALGAEHPNTLDALGSLAWTLCELGRHVEAEPLQRRAHRPKPLPCVFFFLAMSWAARDVRQ